MASTIDRRFLAALPKAEARMVSQGPAEWSVEVKVRHAVPPREVVDATDDLLEALAPHSAAASAGPETMTVRMSVIAETLVGASAAATKAVADAWTKIRRAHQLQSILGGEALTPDELEQRLAHPPFPEIIGVAELAALLDVTRQRASYLAQGSAGFPAPFARLAAGPVWLKPAVMRFVESWERRPRGRPRKVSKGLLDAGNVASALHGKQS